MLLTTRHQIIHIPRIHQPRPRLFDIRDPSQPHTRLQLILENLAQMLHPLLPIAQTIQKRPPDPHSRGPERERLQNIRTPRDPTVHIDLTLLKYLRTNAMQLQQRKQSRLRRVERAPAMVRQHDTLNTARDRGPRVRGALDPLDHNRQARRISDPGDVVPAQRLVDVLAHEPAHAAAFLVVGRHGAADGRGDVVGRDALVRFALPRDVGVDGDEDGAHA